IGVPRGTAQGRNVRCRERAHVAPGVGGEVVAPDRCIIEINLAPPLPAVAAAERRETNVAGTGRYERILGVATNAGRRSVRFPQCPFRRERIERPDFRALFAATALIVSAVANDQMMDAIPYACAF